MIRNDARPDTQRKCGKCEMLGDAAPCDECYRNALPSPSDNLGEQGGWIRCEDGLPEFKMHSETERVLTYSNAGCINKGFYYNGKWRHDNGAVYAGSEYITHWQPLPNPPITNKQIKK